MNNPITKKKIAVFHPYLTRGGSEAVSLWTVAALKDNYSVIITTVIPENKIDIADINKYYGTDLSEKDFLVIKTPLFLKFFKPDKLSSLRNRLAQRYCRKVAGQFDLIISSCNISSFEKRVIQVIGDFYFDENVRYALDVLPTENKDWLRHNKIFLRKIYLKFCDLISPPLLDWSKDIIISNSNWTKKMVLEKYGVDSLVVYPPVIGLTNYSEGLPFEKRENGFVYIGRIAPEKNIEGIIRILDKVRQMGNNIHLHIAGGLNNSPYANLIRNICSNRKDWIFLEGSLDKIEKNKLFAGHRFGISGRTNEPFGISVAEMAKSGCIVFVPNGGGQTEIVNATQLIYENEHDAVEKINKVLNDKNMQIDLQKNLLKMSQRFSTESFGQSMKNIVSKFFETA